MRKPIKKRALHEYIVDNLVDMILTGELTEGEKINEQYLCDTLEISRTPLREALRVLGAEGLVELIPQRGHFVAKPTFDEVLDMFALMAVLEGFCAREATQKMSDEDLKKLKKLHEQLELAYKNDNQKTYLDYNNQLHLFLQDLASNVIANQVVLGLRRRMLLFRYKTLNLEGRFKHSIEEHREIIKSIEGRDPDEAEKTMRNHIKEQAEVLKILNARQDLDDN
ncbi:MAG: GntR family transcriptional regulator [Desulfarculaceae bacterium]|jgi:DNA-binding GntR family transcriptional regulator